MEKFEKLMHSIDYYSWIEDAMNNNLLSLSSKIGDIRVDEKSRMPLHINVISISAVGKLKETAHSSILQHLLKYQPILDSFIDSVVGIKDTHLLSENVRKAEQERIDISIYNRNLCLIIENKVNNAVEQPGQIFRYVQRALKSGYEEEQIIVLYLNSNHYFKPSDFSLTENGESVYRIPKLVENNIIVKDYAHDIYNWVKELPTHVSSSEEYIISALHQYQDFLEEKFYLKDKSLVSTKKS